MNENIFVWYQGDTKRGNEIIKALEALGGKNAYKFNGANEESGYYIDPCGEIDMSPATCLKGGPYKQATLPNYPEGWRAEPNERYWFINAIGEIVEAIDTYSDDDDKRKEYGNYFQSPSLAEIKRGQIEYIQKN